MVIPATALKVCTLCGTLACMVGRGRWEREGHAGEVVQEGAKLWYNMNAECM